MSQEQMPSQPLQSYRYKITIEYFGKNYCGWQRQNHALAVQQVIEDALFQLTKKNIEIVAAGRTDSGVHAYGQVAHFDLDEVLDCYKLTGSLNHFVRNEQVAILHTERVDCQFNARFSAIKRHYVYKILNRRAKSIIDSEYKAWIKEDLDVDMMRQAASYLIGNHDFSSFRSSMCQSHSPFKTLDEIRILSNGDDIEIYCSALSFMHHMVRNIVGTLEQVGKGRWQPEKVKEILQRQDRSAAGPTAPAHGLYFLRVDY